ncbi:Maf-like protein [Nitratireductor sp. GISD-1A_MAKvit]|uniref:Maf-like protein n=1 Tax=Nitratireductor sp. GISD-1A_MAKvit TaxID=3234198 RepID=UPI003466FDCF
MTDRPAIVLASGSAFRQKMLRDAGVEFQVERSTVDERAVEETLEGSGADPEMLAQVLAEAKAIEVSEREPGAFVIGADQTLSLGDEVFHKPSDMEGARRHLLKLSGRTHQLNSAVVIARDGEVIWRHVGVARLTMRDLDPAFIGRHLSSVGEKALQSVGAYQIEGEGIQLFEKIEGDTFTIVGLPLLPLLAELRSLGAIDG